MRKELASIHPAFLWLGGASLLVTMLWQGYQLVNALGLDLGPVWIVTSSTVYGLPSWFLALVAAFLTWLWLGGGD